MDDKKLQSLGVAVPTVPQTIGLLSYHTGAMEEMCGWFTSLSVEFRDAQGAWHPVEGLVTSPPLPSGEERFNKPHFVEYLLAFQPVETRAIRLIGETGGVEHWTTAVNVFGNINTPKQRVAGVERSEPPARLQTGGSLRSTPATRTLASSKTFTAVDHWTHESPDKAERVCVSHFSSISELSAHSPLTGYEHCAGYMSPGFHERLRGRESVIVTHPHNLEVACTAYKATSPFHLQLDRHEVDRQWREGERHGLLHERQPPVAPGRDIRWLYLA